MYNIFEQLPCSQSEVKAHTNALSQMAKDEEHKALFGHFYECLTILDGKSASLLSFNSIIIAVFAIFMAGAFTILEFVILNLGITLALIPSILLLFVVWIHWSTTADLSNLDQHAITLLKVRRTRTIKYRISWHFSASA